ncbi:DUF3343 domain-containing protein [Raoultibacter massiliensis]|uniref:DUF3343 domain-containing protein n=1 Tax=Raoultibacter massiliensis TaxID=1852371 RepID=A0ABV1JD07_9ACTN
MSDRPYVISFDSTHAAMAANSALAGAPFAMIPTPREISAGCGMSLRFSAEDDGDALAVAKGIADIAGRASLYAEGDDGYRLLEKL